MKAQTKTYWFIGMLVVIAITVIIFLKEFQAITSVITNLVARTSSDVVSSQLSNLMTISGAAPYQIEINYTPSKSVLYDVSLSSRELNIKSKYKASYLVKLPSIHPVAIDLPDASYTDVNTFKVKKTVINGESVYEFIAQKS